MLRDTDPEDLRYLALYLSEKGQAIFQEMESLNILAQALKGPRCC
jgi:hypothetical protein